LHDRKEKRIDSIENWEAGIKIKAILVTQRLVILGQRITGPAQAHLLVGQQ
jgi:hypothetical protein